ncbi:hypothetical protein V8C40DRAFT_250178 [Trichoderma camerunense]
MPPSVASHRLFLVLVLAPLTLVWHVQQCSSTLCKVCINAYLYVCTIYSMRLGDDFVCLCLRNPYCMTSPDFQKVICDGWMGRERGGGCITACTRAGI